MYGQERLVPKTSDADDIMKYESWEREAIAIKYDVILAVLFMLSDGKKRYERYGETCLIVAEVQYSSAGGYSHLQSRLVVHFASTHKVMFTGGTMREEGKEVRVALHR